jgi:hypothetical protein
MLDAIFTQAQKKISIYFKMNTYKMKILVTHNEEKSNYSHDSIVLITARILNVNMHGSPKKRYIVDAAFTVAKN